MSQNWNC